MERNCKDCKFWQGDTFDDTTGLCRRYAPRPGYSIPVKGSEPIDSLWPRTGSNDYCGEWSAKVELGEGG